ncbi:hypothetical protein LXA43DRAFT_1027124 [Ganoderma leucocontextum]|nr:hypothetical protein LXA43DRAFT_1027124 [Ganoderma leucocontextum]
MPRTRFDPLDVNIPPVLRERIESWLDDPPSTQFQQYGPINRYLNLKFDHDDHMIKPQALFREPVPPKEEELIAIHGADPDDDLPSDPDEADIVADLRIDIQRGDISIDSTHEGLVGKTVKEGHKLYPDFVVCTFVGNPRQAGSEKDRVLIVIEIASLPRGKPVSEFSSRELKGMKLAVLQQLEGYMEILGEKGDRWDDKVVGIALLGTEVAFLQPREPGDGDHHEWKTYKPKKSKKEWFSLYGKEFLKFVNDARDR